MALEKRSPNKGSSLLRGYFIYYYATKNQSNNERRNTMKKVTVTKEEEKKKENKALKVGLTIAGIALLGGTGYALSKHIKKQKAIAKVNKDILKNYDSLSRNSTIVETVIDEAIYTDLAQAIEDTVLDRGMEKAIIERSYDLGDNIHKFVSVSIENVYGD